MRTNAELAKKHKITRQAFGCPLLALFKLGHNRFFHNRLVNSAEDREISRRISTEGHARMKAATKYAIQKRKEAARRVRKAKCGCMPAFRQ